MSLNSTSQIGHQDTMHNRQKRCCPLRVGMGKSSNLPPQGILLLPTCHPSFNHVVLYCHMIRLTTCGQWEQTTAKTHELPWKELRGDQCRMEVSNIPLQPVMWGAERLLPRAALGFVKRIARGASFFWRDCHVSREIASQSLPVQLGLCSTLQYALSHENSTLSSLRQMKSRYPLCELEMRSRAKQPENLRSILFRQD